MVVSRELRFLFVFGRVANIDRLEFVFFAGHIDRIIAFSCFEKLEARDQRNLKEFAAVILKNVGNPVLLRKGLQSADVRHECVEQAPVFVLLKHGQLVCATHNSPS